MSSARVSFASESTISFPSMAQWLCSKNVFFYRSISRRSSWYSKWEVSHHLHLKSLARNRLSQSWLHHVVLAPCVNNSPVMAVALAAKMVLLPRIFQTGGGKLFGRSANGGWWPPLPPLSRLSWFRLWILPHVTLEHHGNHWIWGWESFGVIKHLLTPAVRLCCFGSYWWVPGGKLDFLERQINGVDLCRAYSCLYRETNERCWGSGYASSSTTYKSQEVWSNSCRA